MFRLEINPAKQLPLKRFFLFCACSSFFILLLNACAVGPDYKKPDVETPVAFDEKVWVVATPGDLKNTKDANHKAPWWEIFQDPLLNELEAQVAISNQNIIAAKAAYDQTMSVLTQNRANYFPEIGASVSGERDGNKTTKTQGNKYQASLTASWELNIWGQISRSVSSAKASAQASEADLAAATLSTQAQLANSYFSLRETDIQYALVAETVEAYQRSLKIAQNLFNAGVTTSSDVLQATTQLNNAQAQLLGIERERKQLERAIAVLIGKTPESFKIIANNQWQATLPQIPVGVPSDILQRRPDVAAAERRVASANEQIGVAKSGYFPSLKLSASEGASASEYSHLFDNNLNIWSIGLGATESLFSAGATQARVAGAKASYQQTVAHYRQTVLSAFEDVENQLTGIRILTQQYQLRVQAADAANKVEQQSLNRYRAGQISYSEVITAQTSALNARLNLAQSAADAQNATVALIQALGGDWNGQLTE